MPPRFSPPGRLTDLTDDDDLQGWSDAVSGDAGFDPIIGQAGNRAPESRVTQFVQGEREGRVAIPYRFVISTGAAYLFAPSISAIRDVLAAG